MFSSKSFMFLALLFRLPIRFELLFAYSEKEHFPFHSLNITFLNSWDRLIIVAALNLCLLNPHPTSRPTGVCLC